ncbi:MAG: aldo/keto reductase [Planctomycetia bacterium]|nr:aldo/keto reductase [Planctomycetia bacterium]
MKNVPYITLNNGRKMPQLGFGTWTLTGETAVRSVKEAMKAGYRLVDSAQGYGNEVEVFQGVRESGVDRKDVFLTTKIAPNIMRDGTVRESLDKSLAALGGEYIDLVLIHWPVKERVEETWKIMEEYVEKGKVRAIGMSNFNPHHIDDLLKYAKIKPVLNQIEIHPYMTQHEVAGYTFRLGIPVQSWSPLGSGVNGVLQDATVAEVAKKYGKSPAQVLIRWGLQRGLCVIPRSTNPAHIAENIDVFDFELCPVDMVILNGLNKNERVNSKNDPDSFPW